MTVTIRDPESVDGRIAASYSSVPHDTVVSSGHVLLCRKPNAAPAAWKAESKRIARTLRSLSDHGLVAVEPRVWRTEDRDLLIRLDGFGDIVDMDADAARLALIETLGAPEPSQDLHAATIDALHAIASTMHADHERISCSAPMAWRPASFDSDPSPVAMFDWWTGSIDRFRRPALPARVRTPVDAETARLLPCMTFVGDGPVTLDGRFGLLLRPVSWAGRTHQTMDTMGIIRAHAALADMLARHPVRDAEETR